MNSIGAIEMRITLTTFYALASWSGGNHVDNLKSNLHAPKIRVLIYSGVQILLGVSKWRMRTQIHTGVYLHMGKFTSGSDQMQILFLQIHTCKFTTCILSHVNAK